MKKKTIIILLILTLSIYALNINVQIIAEENDYRPTSLELTPHGPISITSDSDFGIFPGTGTAEDPYLIDGYNITTTSQSGIYIRGTTKYFIVRNCYIDSNYYGIVINRAADGTVTVINNTLTNCGLSISEATLNAYISYTVENNWVNGKKIGFYTNLDSVIIAEPVYGQLILINCTNVTVRDQILNSVSTSLFLYSCSSSVIINNMCNNNGDYGIYLRYSGSSTVANNTCSNNNNVGIAFEFSGSSTVINNTCNNNYYGIYLYYSSNSTVANNTCSNNERGIRLADSGSSTVANNTCSNNDGEGIYLSYSSSSAIINNTFSNNNHGIDLSSSISCVVTYNLIQENEKYGISFSSGSENNFIHHNNFIDNNLGGTSQACDDGTNNTWYDTATLEGNYWSDWSGIGNYSIYGSAGAIDLYPLDEPAEYSTDENQIYFTFTLLMLVVPLILTRIILKTTKKK